MGTMKHEEAKRLLAGLADYQAYLHEQVVEALVAHEAAKHGLQGNVTAWGEQLQLALRDKTILLEQVSAARDEAAKRGERRDAWHRRCLELEGVNIRLRELVVRMEKRLQDAGVPFQDDAIDELLNRKPKAGG